MPSEYSEKRMYMYRCPNCGFPRLLKEEHLEDKSIYNYECGTKLFLFQRGHEYNYNWDIKCRALTPSYKKWRISG
jgi:DNA-directed RNA polymerase subunit RPC12/RpoP